MFTIKIMRPTEIVITEAPYVSILTEDHGGEELRAHIADRNIKAANAGCKDSEGFPVMHGNMLAVLFHNDVTTYLYEKDHCYVTNENNKTVFSI